MKKMYYNLLIKSFKTNSKKVTLKTSSFSAFIINRLSNLFVPIFIILKIKPNTITVLNFFVCILSLILLFLYKNLFFFSILLFLVYQLLDNIDGGVARHYKIKTYFGKYIDSLSDVFFASFFYIGISLVTYQLTSNYHLLLFTLLSSSLIAFDVFILDKFSALVRWSNNENKKKFPPYIRKKKFIRFFTLLQDITFISTIYLPFVLNDLFLLQKIIILIYVCILISAISNILLHLFFALKYLNQNKR